MAPPYWLSSFEWTGKSCCLGFSFHIRIAYLGWHYVTKCCWQHKFIPVLLFNFADLNIEDFVMCSVLTFIGSIDVRYILKYSFMPYYSYCAYCFPNYIFSLSEVLVHTSFIWNCLTSCWLQCQLSFFLGHPQDQKMWTHFLMQQCLRLLDKNVLILVKISSWCNFCFILH